MKLVCVYKGGKRKSQREIYTDGDTACLLALGLMGLFLVWIGVSFAVVALLVPLSFHFYFISLYLYRLRPPFV